LMSNSVLEDREKRRYESGARDEAHPESRSLQWNDRASARIP
jgi:hypothetical protein